ncbi:glutathionylspermidine synthase [Actinoplanes campanulatus]|uniref:Glutathionylspermidine synthase n=1 Tax=Actinoplanes campanulatus TaxID=113559 RepID=A0A7W5FCJ2_9ACTN|nr:glutathionylspermidine synthase family protein [Actinoplanes campanulatus]MBB3093326.1 glutathionylspermidine synthase [Actinoplanes campanulatus]GGN02797.1 putative glutathionylspermidine synthase [Actinoplanes campanulatus]GID33579.1 putative glutathionylspermidine synthase [Actinoplanes campanulatus]
MRRIPYGPVRDGWQLTNYSLGLTYNDDVLPDGTAYSYWQEGPYYEFTAAEIEELEAATTALYAMCLEAGDWMAGQCPRRTAEGRRQGFFTSVCTADSCFLTRIGIPEYTHEQILRTWFDGDAETWTHRDKDPDGRLPMQTPDYSPTVYGRFDLWYNGAGTVPRLLEFNAQTPTSLVEGAVIQWHWMDQTGVAQHEWRQWNSIHERLVGWEDQPGEPGDPGAWRRNIAKLREARPWLPEKPKIYFAYETSETSGEDRMNVAYLMATAEEAGFPVELIAMSQIGWDVAGDRVLFVPGPGQEHRAEPIDVVFMLYPWEWFWHEEGGKAFFRNMADPEKRGTVWIEPPYKAALLGNKALLPVLWKLFGDDPERSKYLLPSYFAESSGAGSLRSYAKKPVWGREGGSVTLVRDGVPLTSTPSEYGADGRYIVQELCELPSFDGLEGTVHPVIGSWLIDGEPAGMGIREGLGTAGLVTTNTCNFVPHVVGIA